MMLIFNDLSECVKESIGLYIS